VSVLISKSARASYRLSTERVARVARRMLASLGCSNCELSIVLCDDQIIRNLNARYRGQRKATDVLAFGTTSDSTSRLLGDVVISLQTADRQAKAHGATLFRETAFLLGHGLLHLLGMDHDTPRRAAAMNRQTRALLGGLGLEAPDGVYALARVPKDSTKSKHRPKVRPRPGTQRKWARHCLDGPKHPLLAECCCNK